MCNWKSERSTQPLAWTQGLGVFFFVIAFAVSTGAQLEAQVPVSAGTIRQEARIQVGDAVRVTVWRSPEMSGTFEIGADSVIIHPLYSAVKIAGLTTEEAVTVMRDFLVRFDKNPQFVLEPLFPVVVGGEVQAPTLYRFSPGVTLAQAMLMAGGPTQRANEEDIRLFRGGEELRLDLRGDSAAGALPLLSGDRIIVRRARNVFRDWIVPIASVAGAALSFTNLALRVF